jgi:hypothetical protein
MPTQSQEPSNFQILEQAEIINASHPFSDEDKELIESLSPAEVNSLIAIAEKLGKNFLWEHGGGPTAGILF